MKKIFYLAAFVMISLTATFCLTSCDSNNENGGYQEPTFTDAGVPMTYNLSSDLLELFDVSFEVTKFDGTKETIKVTSAGETSKEYTTKSSSGTMKIEPKVAFKDGVSVETVDKTKSYNVAVSIVIKPYYHKSDNTAYVGTPLVDNAFALKSKITSQDMLDLYKERIELELEGWEWTLKDGRFQ